MCEEILEVNPLGSKYRLLLAAGYSRQEAINYIEFNKESDHSFVCSYIEQVMPSYCLGSGLKGGGG